MTLGTAMTARQSSYGRLSNICLQVWLAASLLSEIYVVLTMNNTAYFQKYHNYFSIRFALPNMVNLSFPMVNLKFCTKNASLFNYVYVVARTKKWYQKAVSGLAFYM
jgi:hypothetical protein